MLDDIKDILIEGNLKYKSKFIQEFEKAQTEDSFPKYPVLILTCMDPRIDIHRIFQLNPGDLFILRNAGNVFTLDIMRSILLAIVNYKIKYIIILGHLDCGMKKINLTELRMKLPSEFLSRLSKNNVNVFSELRNFFLPFSNEIKNIIEQIKSLQTVQDLFPEIEITGMLYDTNTGWVLNYDEFKDLDSLENFNKIYEGIIEKKIQQLNKHLEELKKELDENKINEEVILNEEKNSIPIEEDDLLKVQDDEFQSLLKKTSNRLQLTPLKIQVPKIHVPKLKVHLPKYVKNRDD
ncbi:MAG: carbonic anhydrase [Promethearchaeota archaeon]